MESILPLGWCCTSLEQVATWGSGGTPSRNIERYFQGTIPWVKTGELESKYIRETEEHISVEALNNSSAKIFPKGSVGIAMYGATIGKLSIWGIDASTNQACAVGIPTVAVNNEFLYYYLLSERQSLIKAGKGGAQPNLSQGIIKEWPINLPPHPEQHRIVAKIEELFSELDKGIENLKTAHAQLKVYRQALLKHAFEGKLTAQWREERRTNNSVTPAQAGVHANEKLDSRLRGNDEMGGENNGVSGGNDETLETADALLKRIQQERAQRYQQQLADWQANGGSKPKAPKPLPPLTAEELAELPDGWGWAKLGDAVETNVGFAFKSSEFSSSGIRLLRGENIEPRQLRWTDTRFWPSDRTDEFNALLVMAGEIIIAMDRPVISSGLKVTRVRQSDTPCLLVQRVARIKEQQGICTSYIFSAIDQNRFINHCLGNQTGTQLPHISEAQIRAYPVPLCSYEEQALISQEIDSRMSEVDQLELTITTSLQQAEALRQSILKKAFSGQLVPQDPHDEPASVLLARIRAARATAKENLVVRQRGKRAGG
jgi:type I restriction enzyme S subunit